MIPEWLCPSLQTVAQIQPVAKRVIGEPSVVQRRNLRHALWCALNPERRRQIVRRFEARRVEYKKRWKRENPEKVRASVIRRAEHRREYAKAYYQRNREKILARLRERSGV